MHSSLLSRPTGVLAKKIIDFAPSPLTHKSSRRVYNVGLLALGGVALSLGVYALSSRNLFKAALGVASGSYLLGTAYLLKDNTEKRKYCYEAIISLQEEKSLRFEVEVLRNLSKLANLGGEEEIKKLFESTLKINEPLRGPVEGMTFRLQYAVSHNDYLLTKVLLEILSSSGIEIEHIDPKSILSIDLSGYILEKKPALQIALEKGYYDIVCLFISPEDMRKGYLTRESSFLADKKSPIEILLQSDGQGFEGKKKICEHHAYFLEHVQKKEERGATSGLFSAIIRAKALNRELYRWVVQNPAFSREIIRQSFQDKQNVYDCDQQAFIIEAIELGAITEKDSCDSAYENMLDFAVSNEYKELALIAIKAGFNPNKKLSKGENIWDKAYKAVKYLPSEKKHLKMLEIVTASPYSTKEQCHYCILEAFKSLNQRESIANQGLQIIAKITRHPAFKLLLTEREIDPSAKEDLTLFCHLIKNQTFLEIPEQRKRFLEVAGIFLKHPQLKESFSQADHYFLFSVMRFAVHNLPELFDLINEVEGFPLEKICAKESYTNIAFIWGKKKAYQKLIDSGIGIDISRFAENLSDGLKKRRFGEVYEACYQIFVTEGIRLSSEEKESILKVIKSCGFAPMEKSIRKLLEAKKKSDEGSFTRRDFIGLFRAPFHIREVRFLFNDLNFLSNIPLKDREKIIKSCVDFKDILAVNLPEKEKKLLPNIPQEWNWSDIVIPEEYPNLIHFVSFVQGKPTPFENKYNHGLPNKTTNPQEYLDAIQFLEKQAVFILRVADKSRAHKNSLYKMLDDLGKDCGNNFFQNFGELYHYACSVAEEKPLGIEVVKENYSQYSHEQRLDQVIEDVLSELREEISLKAFDSIGKIGIPNTAITAIPRFNVSNLNPENDNYYLLHMPDFRSLFLEAVQKPFRLRKDVVAIPEERRNPKEYYDIMKDEFNRPITPEMVSNVCRSYVKSKDTLDSLKEKFSKKLKEETEEGLPVKPLTDYIETLSKKSNKNLLEETIEMDENEEAILKYHTFWIEYLLIQKGVLQLSY